MRETWNLCYVGSVNAGDLELPCYVGSVNAGDLELVLCGFRKCGRETWNLCYVGSVNAGDLELVLCGFRKGGRLGTCVMWVP